MRDDRSIRRHEDPPLLSGTAGYVADLAVPRQLEMVVVRSRLAHGTIREVDVSEALSLDGVVAAWTASDLIAELGEVPRIPPRVSFDEAVVPYLQPILATDRARYVGEPVAVIVATDRYVAEDAAELVVVDVDQLPAVVEPRSAADGEALFPEGNLITTLHAEFGDAHRALSAAPIVVRTELLVGRHSGVSMETRGILVDYEESSGRCYVYGATKVPHWNKKATAELLGFDPQQLVMRETAVGGGFGVRGELYPEDVLAVWAARRLRRPVRWIEDRREHLMSANHSREQFHQAAIAGDRQGQIIAIVSEFWVDLGGYVRTHAIRVPDLTLSMLPGPYDIPNYSGEVHCVVTNRTPTGTYRAPGRFESCFVRERLIDIYAAEAGLDPAEVRRRNLISPGQLPYRRPLKSTGEPMLFSEGDYRQLLDRVVAEIDRDEIQRRRAQGELVGAGVAMFLEKSGLGPWETGSVGLDRDGLILVRSGCSSVGQGLRTVLAQIVAGTFEVDPAAVRVELLDTDETPAGIGSYASRSTVTAGSAVRLAAETVIEQARELAARHLEIHPRDLEYHAGGFQVRGDPEARVELTELAARDDATADDGANVLFAERIFDVERVVYPYGTHAAVVKIDEDTGAVDVERLVLGFDIGRSVNPMLVDGQMHGGAVQALGGALFEVFPYDEAGNPLATSFMDYLIPTVAEVPAITALVTETAPTSTNPLGVKGAGEGGITGVAAAVAAAIDDALGSPGAVRSVPVLPETLRGVIARAGAAESPR